MGTTFLKRQKEMKRMEKQRAKAERRAQKKTAVRPPTDEFGELIGAEAGEPGESEDTVPEEVAPETSSPA